jgi:hypothetical protein
MITRLIAFEVTPDQHGGFGARGVEADLLTQGKTREEVQANVRKAVKSHFSDQPGNYEVGTIFRLSESHTERVIDYVQVS